jgi:Protein of unknown function, DUF481
MNSSRISRVLAFLLCASGWTLAGFVAPTSAEGQDTPAAWRTQLDLGVNSSSGNTKLTTILAGVVVRRLETESLEVQLSANYRYGESDDRTIADLFRQEAKIDINPKANWSPFLFQSITRNPVRRVALRANGGVGGKLTFWRGEKGKSSVSFAGIYNYEDIDAIPGTPATETEKALRWSSRFKFDYKFNERSRVQSILFYQPVWNTLGDYYVILSNTLVVGVGGGLSLTVSHEFNHDETPAQGIVRDDAYLSVGFRFVF